MSSSSDCLLCADVSPASTGHSLPLSSPCMPSPACLEPPSHLLLTDASVRSRGRPGPVLSAPDASDGQVCTKLRSSSLRASLECGLSPEVSSVQPTPCNAVAGLHSSSSQCTILHASLSSTVAPNSNFMPVPSCSQAACALPFTPVPSSTSELPAATGRPLGCDFTQPSLPVSALPPDACAPLFATAAPPAPVPARAVNLVIGPSKRRLIVTPGPKIAKRLKLG